jgi:ribosomal protein S18 acetylase RimI-like enzyme
MAEGRQTAVLVRPLAGREAKGAARLHVRELPHEFLTRLGTGFLTGYYRAFVESPHATALAATDPKSGDLLGVLIGAFDTRAHYAYLVRRYGLALAVRVALRVLRDPGLARDLLRTRAARYARGVLRSLRYGRREPGPAPEKVGFLTYVAVDRERRGRGIGGSLVSAYEKLAREAGLDRLELVTLPDERGAGSFYDKLGWKYEGERVSRSGERYAFYSRAL